MSVIQVSKFTYTSTNLSPSSANTMNTKNMSGDSCIRPIEGNKKLGGGGGGTHYWRALMGGHRYENFRAQMRNLLRLRYEKDGGKDMEIIWRTHVETMRGGGTDVKMIEGG